MHPDMFDHRPARGIVLGLCLGLYVAQATADESVRDGADSPAPAAEARADAAPSVAALAFVEPVPGHFVHVGAHADMHEGNGGDIAVGGFVVGTRSVAVIDPGGSVALGRAFARAVRARTPLPVSHVVLTHFHPDHVFGAAAFVGAGVAVLAHANFVRARTQRGGFYAERFAALLDGLGREALVAPTLEVGVGEPRTIELGERRLQLVAHPTAHTDNDLTLFDPDARVLWAGDLLFEGRTPALDGSLLGWLDVIDSLAALEPRLAVPGHGEPGPLEPMLEAQRRYLRDLLENTRAALASGASLSERLLEAERERAPHWALFAMQHPTNVTRAWTELEWE